MPTMCFGLDWSEVAKLPGPQAIIDEILGDDSLGRYSTPLPMDLARPSDWLLEGEVGFSLSLIASEETHGLDREALQLIVDLFTTEDPDDLGVRALSNYTVFQSLSPDRISGLVKAFAALNLSQLEQLHVASGARPTSGFLDHLEHYRNTLRWAHDRGLGLVWQVDR